MVFVKFCEILFMGFIKFCEIFFMGFIKTQNPLNTKILFSKLNLNLSLCSVRGTTIWLIHFNIFLAMHIKRPRWPLRQPRFSVCSVDCVLVDSASVRTRKVCSSRSLNIGKANLYDCSKLTSLIFFQYFLTASTYNIFFIPPSALREPTKHKTGLNALVMQKA